MCGFPSVDESIGDINSSGPQLERLHFVLDLEPVSDIIAQENIFLATERLVNALKAINPSGVVFLHDNVEVVGDANFRDVFKANFDEWWWLQILGAPGKDDFGYKRGWLIVSEKVMEIMKQFRLDYCTVEEFQAD
jgi:hypothetical protein